MTESRRDSSELDQSIITDYNDSFYGEYQLSDNNLDLSQVSGWSAMTPGWNDSFKLNLTESDEEASQRVQDHMIIDDSNMEVKNSLHDIFIENCCTLYNDIQNFIDDIEFDDQIQCIDKFEKRQERLMEQATLLAESASDLTDIIYLRMQTINRAMEQLKIKHSSDSARSNSSRGQVSPIHELRKWLQTVEIKLENFRDEIDKNCTISSLQRLTADNQVLQLQIETEGQTLVSSAKKQLQLISANLSNDKKQEKRHKTLEQLEQRLLSTWLKSLENLERINYYLKKLQDNNQTDQESISEDEEPIIKRRRTLSNNSTTITSINHINLHLSPCSTIDSDVQLIPSSTESESGNIIEEDNYIPFDPIHNRSTTIMTTNIDKNLNLQWNNDKKSTTLCLSNKLLDIGYSSGENSLNEINHSSTSSACSSGDISPDSERRLRLKTTPTKTYYKTVPLDDGGYTDIEYKIDKQSLDFELPNIDDSIILSDSLIVQSDNQQNITDDYNEVMEMLDNDQLFIYKLNQLKNGTSWKELINKNKKISNPRKSITELINIKNDDKSCEASSEESDNDKKINLNNTLPPIPGRKRRFKKAIRQNLHQHQQQNITGSMEIMKNSLTNVAMDESIYVFKDNNNSDLMSQSLNSSFNGSISRKSLLNKRKYNKSKIHRSASDHLNLNFNLYDMSNSYHSQNLSKSVFNSFLPSSFGTPLMSSTLKKNGSIHRRQSIESIGSSTSSGTVPETGDAHYEWDEYRDPPSLPDSFEMDATTSTKTPILDDTLIDEDFQSQLSLPDSTNIETIITESKKDYNEIIRLIDDYDALNDEKEDIRSALRLQAKQNVNKLTAIVHGLPRNINMEQINDLEELSKQWKDTLNVLGNDPIDIEMENDTKIVKNIQNHLTEMKDILKKLMNIDAKSIKIEDFNNFINERKNLWINLMNNKESLKTLAETTENNYNNGELFMLLRYIDESLGFVGETTDKLVESMIKYQSTGDIKNALNELEEKIVSNNDDSSFNVEQIQNELDTCQYRLDALENVCNNLTMQLGDIAALEGRTKPGRQTDFWRQFKQFKSEFERLKNKFNEMQNSEKVITTAEIEIQKSEKIEKRGKIETKSSTFTSNKLLMNGNFGSELKQRNNLKRELSSTSTNTTLNSTIDTSTQYDKNQGIYHKTLKTIKDSKLLQILLGFTGLLIVSLIFISLYFDDTPQNNWRRMFGPQLDYVNGPPPS